MDDDDVRVRQARDRLRLAQQPRARRARRRVGRARPCSELERDLAIELRIVGGVDLAHAAAPDEVEDDVASHADATGQRRGVAARRQQRCRATRRGDVGAGGRRDQLGALRAGGEVLLRRRAAGGIEPSVNERDDGVFVQASHGVRAQRSP